MLDFSEVIKIETLVTAYVLHESGHVEGVKHIRLIHVEVLPSSTEILIHILIKGVTLQLLMLLEDLSRGNLSPLLVHQEAARWRTLVILLLQGVLLQNMVHEFIGRVLVELVRELSVVLLALWGHISVAGEEVSMLRGMFDWGSLWRIVVIVLVTLVNLHVLLIVLLLLHEFILVIIFDVAISLAIVVGFVLLLINDFRLLHKLVIFFVVFRMIVLWLLINSFLLFEILLSLHPPRR